MAQRSRNIAGIEQERDRSGVSAGSRKRITKEAGKLADYSHIKASKGVVIPEVRKVLLNRKHIAAERAQHRTSVIYPSEMAKSNWCPRATYYRMSGVPEPDSTNSMTLENVFAEGNSIHAKWQKWLSETGLLWGDWHCSKCNAYVRNSVKPGNEAGSCVGLGWTNLNQKPPAGFSAWFSIPQLPHDWKYKEVTLRSVTHKISGHADGALINHNCLIEIKSLGIGTLRFEAPKLIEDNTYEVSGKKIIDIDGIWKNLHRPLLSHVKQGNIYLWMSQEMGLPFDSINFIYEFKANQQVKEFSIKMSEDIMTPLLDVCSVIENSLKAGIPPACPFGGCASCRICERA